MFATHIGGMSGLWRGGRHSTVVRAHSGLKEALSLASAWDVCSDFSFPAPISPDVNYEELARCTDDFNGAQCKAVCVEAVSVLLQQPALVRGG